MERPFVTMIKKYLERRSKDSAFFSLTFEEEISDENLKYRKEMADFLKGDNVGKFPPKNPIIERKIDEAMKGLPFVIEANSTEERLIAYERIALLLDSKVGIELLSEAEKVAEKYGKITIKETDKDGASGYIDLKNPLVIHMDPKFRNRMTSGTILSSESPTGEYLRLMAEKAFEQNAATSTLAHEMRHIIQLHHPDCNIATSMENYAQKDLMREIGGRITNICYEAETGRDTPEVRLYNLYMQYAKNRGLTDEQAQKETRTTIATIYLTGAKGMDFLEPEIKKEAEHWLHSYKKQALHDAASKKFSSGSDSVNREQNYMNYLCDNMGIDRGVLNTLATVFEENHEGNKLILDNVSYEQSKEKGTDIVKTKTKTENGESEIIFVDGCLKEIFSNYEGGSRKTMFYPDRTIKSERIVDENFGWKETQYNEQGQKIKETKNWEGKTSETFFYPSTGQPVQSGDRFDPNTGEPLFKETEKPLGNSSHENTRKALLQRLDNASKDGLKEQQKLSYIQSPYSHS